MARPRELGPLLLQREFVATEREGRASGVLMRLGVPAQDAEHPDSWCCSVELEGGGRHELFGSFGADALQSLLLGLSHARARLEGWAKDDGGSVTWMDRPGELGLPDDPPMDLLAWQSRAARLLDEARVAARASSASAEPAMVELASRIDALLQGWNFGRADSGSPMPALDVGAAYDLWARTYDTNDNATRDLDALVLGRLLPRLAGASVLEVGVGTGKNSAALAEARLLVGVDLSAGMLARAKARLPGAARAALLRADLLAPLPFATGSFDLATIDLVLEHIADVHRVIAEVARVLRPGGRVIVIELHPYRQRLGNRAHFEDPATGQRVDIPVFLHTVSELAQAGLGAGLRLEHLGEWHDELSETPSSPPRLLSLMFRRDA